MRIIAGEFGGRRIQPPSDQATRPMLDRVREALFATLGERVEDAVVLDLFAGTGSLGLEAASRGAARVRSVERGRRALAALRANVEALGVGDRVEIVAGDAFETWTWGERGQAARVDVAFLDPPYAVLADGASRRRLARALDALAREWLAAEGTLVLHLPSRERADDLLPPSLACERRVYGTSALMYGRPEPEP